MGVTSVPLQRRHISQKVLVGKRTGKKLNCKTEADEKIIVQQNLKEKDERLEIYTIKLGMGNGGGTYCTVADTTKRWRPLLNGGGHQ